jgi:hypothetical protein
MATGKLRWAVLLGLAACKGTIVEPTGVEGEHPQGPRRPGDPTVEVPPVDLCAGKAVALSDIPLRRLSTSQYQQTVRDLLGDPGFVAELDDDAHVITERGVRQLRDAAELAISRRGEWTIDPISCATSDARDEACANALIDDLATRAFRRPVQDDERTWLLDVYATLPAELDQTEALEALVELILQAPQTVYVDEGDQTRVPGIYRLDDWALASRLAYFLWNTMPDRALFEAAASGQLADPEGLRAEVERMLDDPRSLTTIQSFIRRWLQLDGGRLHHALEESPKDEALFPEYGPELQTAMRIELDAFVERLASDEDATFDDLLNSRWAYVNQDLAELYGVAAPAEDWGWIELDETERAGALTRAAFLTVFAASNVQSPIRRGVFVIEELLCNELGDPPPNANDVPVVGGTVQNPDGTTTVRSVRQDVTARTQGDDCRGCHGVINPIGFSFEHYDAIGRFQTQELGTGLPLDSSGRLTSSDVDGDLADAIELSKKLGASEKARSCFAKRFTAEALGEDPAALDRCTVKAITPGFVADGKLRGLILELVTGEAFTTTVIGGGE